MFECDLHHQGYARVVISRNDNWNGFVGFYPVNSSVVSGNEDLGQNPRLTIERRNASYGDLTVISCSSVMKFRCGPLLNLDVLLHLHIYRYSGEQEQAS